LKVSANVKIVMQMFWKFRGGIFPPGCATATTTSMHSAATKQTSKICE